jgi:hypothetical protein
MGSVPPSVSLTACHAETTGLGAGGSGLTWNTAGTWATAGGVAANTPVVEAELLTNGNFTAWTGDNPNNWTVDITEDAGNYVTEVAGKCRIVSSTLVTQISQNVVIPNRWHKLTVDITAGTGGLIPKIGGNDCPTIIDVGAKTVTQRAGAASNLFSLRRFAASTDVTIDNVVLKTLPISTLITNQSLVTTDVLAEMVSGAYSLGSQMGISQSDRPFAFKANANAAAGQKVIVLKGLTHAVPDTDTITIKHPVAGGTTYTIASVGALSGGVQTLTLDVNLVEAVSANDWVGVDWSSWNGTLQYFDGAGNIKLDEIKAGVYTNRISAAKAFSAAARLITRKIGSSYYVFYNEALINTTALVDADSMVGTYWGLFSTLAANTITSFVVYDTGNVTNAYATLDKYSA